jgi:hypothetical protein
MIGLPVSAAPPRQGRVKLLYVGEGIERSPPLARLGHLSWATKASRLASRAPRPMLATMTLRRKSICRPALQGSCGLFLHALYACASWLFARRSSGACPEARPA